ncbi:hypothetical protein SUGI_0994850 [Cryptomeria japonica]|nr:hypothetical protein SUGI_0994850 [Cryptomeria japonica]
MKSFILGWNNPGKVLLEPVRSEEEAFDEIPTVRKLMSITKVLHIVPPKIIRRYDLNLAGLTPPEESNAQGGHFTPVFQNMKDVLLPSSVVVVEKDSLHYLLNTENGFLTWDWRMKIAFDVASGLAFLHDSGLIHGNVNSSNVLLPDEINRRTRLADSCSAGLVKNSDSGMADLDKYSSGSWGYMAPKQFYSRKFSKKSDVYSFGVLLLELLTGKDPIKASTHLPKLIFSIDDERWAMEMLDKRLGSYMDIPNVLAMYSIAKQCTSLHEYSRPRMFEVVIMIANSSKVSEESTTNVTFDKNWASLENEIPFTDEDIDILFDTEQLQFEESLDREQLQFEESLDRERLQEFSFQDLYEESLDIEQPQEYSFQDLYEESYFQDLHE